MSEVIWKFPLETANDGDAEFVSVLTMPRLATVLTVQMQRGVPCLWAQVNPANETEMVRVLIVGTGHPLPADIRDDYYYAGTFQVPELALVFHVFIEE